MDDMAKLLWQRMDKQDEKMDKVMDTVSNNEACMARIEGQITGLTQQLSNGDINIDVAATGQDTSQKQTVGTIDNSQSTSISAGGDMKGVGVQSATGSGGGATERAKAFLQQNQLVVAGVGIVAVLTKDQWLPIVQGFIS